MKKLLHYNSLNKKVKIFDNEGAILNNTKFLKNLIIKNNFLNHNAWSYKKNKEKKQINSIKNV
jgi:hypothetical protein